MKKILTAYIFLFSFYTSVHSQSISLTTPMMEEFLRRKQVMGDLPDNYSFMSRPIDAYRAFGIGDGQEFLDISKISSQESVENKGLRNTLIVEPLPLAMNIQYNSKYPFGQNDGAMIPNRGTQVLTSFGGYFEFGKFSLQLQPEILIAQNKDFRGMPNEESLVWKEYYQYLNRIDKPEQFGKGNFNKVKLGNSSFRYNFDNGLSIGISNEYLWWGPSKRNSLMMSNNAPGFLHFTANTQKPFETEIGSFEGQLIVGKLKNSGLTPPNPDMIYAKVPLYVPKRDDDWRYLSGIMLTYQPKWIPGLFVGYSSTSQMYHNDMGNFGDYLPIFNGRKRFSAIDDPVIDKRQQLSAGFFRWFSSKGKFEFYGEYGSNGNRKPLREFIVNPDMYRAFTLGFLKYIPLRGNEQFMQVHLEMTQTGQTVRKAIRESMIWYTHPHVRHGYTHEGQVLGYGYGPGSNSIFIEASWINRLNRVGVQFERIANNNDSFYLHFESINGWDRYWVDIVPSLVFDRQFGNFLVATRLQFQKTLNYYWTLERDPDAELYRLQPGDDRRNFVAHIKFAYIL